MFTTSTHDTVWTLSVCIIVHQRILPEKIFAIISMIVGYALSLVSLILLALACLAGLATCLSNTDNGAIPTEEAKANEDEKEKSTLVGETKAKQPDQTALAGGDNAV